MCISSDWLLTNYQKLSCEKWSFILLVDSEGHDGEDLCASAWVPKHLRGRVWEIIWCFSHTYIWKLMSNGAEQLRNRIDKSCLLLYVVSSPEVPGCSQTFYMSAQKFQRELDKSCIAFFLESETMIPNFRYILFIKSKLIIQSIF